MKIHLDVQGLLDCAKEMGAQASDYSYEGGQAGEFELDQQLEAGLEISIEEINFDKGLLSVHGRQVLLYIADQGNQIQDVLNGVREGKKVHVADCQTLIQMKDRNRFGRYHVTTSITGIYNVFGVDYNTNMEMTGEAELNVCKNCLSFLNYKNYAQSNKPEKSNIYSSFTLDDFFSQFSTVFKSLPKKVGEPTPGYTKDWSSISKAYRQSKKYSCEQCMVDLNGNESLLHCHHISGNKQDNDYANLMSLCANCHRQQPMHSHLYVTKSDMRKINELRRQQNLTNSLSWDETIQYSDTAIQGLLQIYKSKGWPKPDELGLEVTNDKNETIAYADVAWSRDKKALVIEKSEEEKLNDAGWNANTLADEFKAHR